MQSEVGSNMEECKFYTTDSQNTVQYKVQDYKPSKWRCYLFGSNGVDGITYHPAEGRVPNFIVRWFMKVCLGCTWIMEKE